MFNPLVSILIPVYNAEKYLAETIESAINQTYNNIEIIIVDDGSLDHSYEIAKAYESKNCKVIRQENRGASAARNLALSLAQGDFIQWLDADDILDKKKIEKQLQNEGSIFDYDIIHSSTYAIFYRRLKSARLKNTDLFKDLDPLEYLRLHLKYGYYFPNSSWLVNHKLYNLSGFWNEELTYNDDGEFFCRVISKSKFIKFHSDSVCYYRKGSYNSLSRSLGKNKKSLISLNKSINLSCDYLLNIDSSRESKEACISALSYASNIIKDKLPIEYSQNLRRINYLGGVLLIQKKSLKYKIVEKILGEKVAVYLKGLLWNLKIKFEEIKDLLK